MGLHLRGSTGASLTSYATQVAALPDYPTEFPSANEIEVLVYSGDVGTTRPAAEFVVWQGYPTQPTNMADGDLWLSDVGGTLLISTAAPTNGDGTNGDGWINKTTMTFYGPKAAGVWPSGQALKGADGANGRGISSIARTSGTGAAGSTDTYTITYSDASTSTFTVVNGSNGAGSSITVQDEGGSLATAATTINFVGTGVNASGTGATKTVTIPALDRGATHGPTGAVRANMDRTSTPMNGAVAATSGTIYVSLTYGNVGDVLTSVSIRTGSGTGVSSGTHSWAVLTDSAGVVLAVSADDTTATTATGTTKTWTFTSPYTVTTAGKFYFGYMQAATSYGVVGSTGLVLPQLNIPPIAHGTAGTGQTTPPSLGATLTVAALASLTPYMWLT